MAVVPLERRNLVIVAGREGGLGGASLFHFVPVADIEYSPELAAEMTVAVPPHLLKSVIAVAVAVAVGLEEGPREASTRHFVDLKEAANAPERVVVEKGRREVSVSPRHFVSAANNPERTAAKIVVRS
jgi:hypothetical protein